MMEYFIVCLAALVASGLTLFSGFGLGTILTPVLAIFFPVPLAVGATAIAHLANNLFKLFFMKKVTLRAAQIIAGAMLIVLGIALSVGLI